MQSLLGYFILNVNISKKVITITGGRMKKTALMLGSVIVMGSLAGCVQKTAQCIQVLGSGRWTMR